MFRARAEVEGPVQSANRPGIIPPFSSFFLRRALAILERPLTGSLQCSSLEHRSIPQAIVETTSRRSATIYYCLTLRFCRSALVKTPGSGHGRAGIEFNSITDAGLLGN